jgi:GNAT superfamily N-acetyltransferase
MSLSFIHESPARWDQEKAKILGSAPPGVFDFSHYRDGDLLPGDWWRVESDGTSLGFGWMDAVWGDAEILLAVAAEARARGVGTFILDHLEQEASRRGLNQLYNVVPPAHPEPERLRSWLEKRHFRPSEDGTLLQRSVRAQS